MPQITVPPGGWNSETTSEQNTPDNTTNIAPAYQRYACYRTQPLGWQEAGYIVVTTDATSADTLPTAASNPDLWTNTAWVADPDRKYRISHVYPDLTAQDKKSSEV